MSAKYLSLAGAALAGALVWSAAAQAAPGQTTQTVNMRSGPAASYAIIGRLPAGAPVNIVTCRNWCELTNGRSTGWVSANSVVAEYGSAPYSYNSEPSLNGISDGFDADNGPWGDGFHHHHDGFGDGGGDGHLGGGHDGFGGGHDGGGGGHGGGGGGRH
jgi:uncharacterized protein YraI